MSHFESIDIDNQVQSAYGEQQITTHTPTVAGSAIYDFVPSNFREFIDLSGVVSVADGLMTCSTGTTQYGYATLQSFRSLNFKTGEGAEVKFGAKFPSNVASSWIGAGGFGIGDEVSFGYNGTDFGVWHRHGGLAEIQDLLITTAATGSENATLTLDGTGYTVALTSGDIAHTCTEIAAYVNASIAGYDAEQCGDDVVISASSDGDKTGAFTFTSASAVGTFSETRAGLTKTSDFTAQADWNGGNDFSTFDPTKGNAYKINYQNGFGDIHYYIYDNTKNKFLLAHDVKWLNTQTSTNLRNPALRVGCYAASVGSTTDVSVDMAYIQGSVETAAQKTRNPRGFSNTKNIGTTLTNLLTIRNNRVYNDLVNQVEFEPLYLTLANDGTKSATFQLRGNPTVAGDTDFQPVGTNLITSSDIVGTTVTPNGRDLASFVVAKGQSLSIDLTPFAIRVPPTLRLVIAAQMTSGAAQDLSAGLTWYEDI